MQPFALLSEIATVPKLISGAPKAFFTTLGWSSLIIWGVCKYFDDKQR